MFYSLHFETDRLLSVSLSLSLLSQTHAHCLLHMWNRLEFSENCYISMVPILSRYGTVTEVGETQRKSLSE